MAGAWWSAHSTAFDVSHILHDGDQGTAMAAFQLHLNNPYHDNVLHWHALLHRLMTHAPIQATWV